MRQLVALPVALFFFACEEEASLLGYKNPNPKFDARYVEIPIESSVLLLDSQRTSNFLFPNTSETNRLLIGQYNDEAFGSVVANGFTQFFPASTEKLPAEATYDSVTLTLRLDPALYNYGSRDASSSQTISVYELADSLQYSQRRYYFNRTEFPVIPTELGSHTFTVNPDSLDYYANRTDTAVNLQFTLDAAFGQRLFDEAVEYAAGSDNSFITFGQFTKLFKGLAIKSMAGDKILGVSPNSHITVHYHTPSTDSLGIQLGFFGLTNFSQIISDRSATELAGLTQYSQDFLPPSDLRYIQAGTGVFTKLDLGKFFEFCDTVPNVAIASAELAIDGIQESSYAPPGELLLTILNGTTNYIEKYSRKNTQDNSDLILYNPPFQAHSGALRYDLATVNEFDSAMYVLGDRTNELAYSSSSKKYVGNYALYFQQLAITAENKRRFQYYVLVPAAPSMPGSKSVNRVVFPKDNLKLKIHYTKPTLPLN